MNEEGIETKFVSLTNDLLFKETYGNPRNIRFLEDLLESYFGYGKGELKDKLKMQYELPLMKTSFKEKAVRGDLVVVIDNKIIVNLEMYSKFNQEAYTKSKVYTMRIYSTQLKSGDSYSDIKKVTQINFVDNVSPELMIEESLISTQYFGPEHLSQDIQMDIARLDIARKFDYTQNERFIKTLKFIGAQSLEERRRISKGDEMLMETEEWIEKYMEENSELFNLTRDEWNKRIYELAGKEEGSLEKQKEIALTMLKNDETIAKIEQYTGLNAQMLEKLKEELD